MLTIINRASINEILHPGLALCPCLTAHQFDLALVALLLFLGHHGLALHAIGFGDNQRRLEGVIVFRALSVLTFLWDHLKLLGLHHEGLLLLVYFEDRLLEERHWHLHELVDCVYVVVLHLVLLESDIVLVGIGVEDILIERVSLLVSEEEVQPELDRLSYRSGL